MAALHNSIMVHHMLPPEIPAQLMTNLLQSVLVGVFVGLRLIYHCLSKALKLAPAEPEVCNQQTEITR
jgi:hypothetical protein